MASTLQNSQVTAAILHARDGVAVAEYGCLCVVIWRQGVTLEKFEHQRVGLAEVVKRHPEGVGFLCIIEPHTRPPNDALRRASIEMLGAHGDRLKCIAVVIEGDGFWAAMTRSVLLGMAMLLSRKIPATAFATAPEALKWMRHYVPVRPTAAVFVEDVRKHLDVSERT